MGVQLWSLLMQIYSEDLHLTRPQAGQLTDSQGLVQNENTGPLDKTYQEIQDRDRRALNQAQGTVQLHTPMRLALILSRKPTS